MKQVENDINGNVRYQFEAKLLSISDATLTNVNGKNFKVVTIEFADVNGVVQRTSGFCYEGNYRHGVALGMNYLTQATVLSDNSVIITMSHLPAAARASADMFGELANELVSSRQTAATFQAQ